MNPNNYQDVDTIVFEGSGINCISYVGVIEELEKLGILNRINNYSGCSSGSIISSLLALGADSKFIKDNLGLFNTDFQDQKIYSTLYNLFGNYGFYKVKKIKSKIRRIFKLIGRRLTKGVHPDITFNELANKWNKNLILAVTDLNGGFCEYIGNGPGAKYGHLKICDVICASISIPFYFQPQKLNGRIYVDGALLDAYPISIWINNGSVGPQYNKIIGVKTILQDMIKQSDSYQINNFGEYCLSIVRLYGRSMTQAHVPEWAWNRTIKIDVSDINTNIFDFNLSQDKRNRLIKKGKESATSFLI